MGAATAPEPASGIMGNPPRQWASRSTSKTIADLSNWNTGFTNIDIVSEVDTPPRWLLRDMPNSRFVNSPAIDERPLLLTSPGKKHLL
jgi:hypothetical protein